MQSAPSKLSEVHKGQEIRSICKQRTPKVKQRGFFVLQIAIGDIWHITLILNYFNPYLFLIWGMVVSFKQHFDSIFYHIFLTLFWCCKNNHFITVESMFSCRNVCHCILNRLLILHNTILYRNIIYFITIKILQLFMERINLKYRHKMYRECYQVTTGKEVSQTVHNLLYWVLQWSHHNKPP